MSFNKLCPRFAEYHNLYPHSARLQASLCDFHASIIRCCKQALEVIQRPCKSNHHNRHLMYSASLLMENTGPSQVFNALWRSFQTEFQPFEAEVKRCSEDVEKEISLAKAQAD